ncbi:MAG: DNA-binding protein Alba [Candidatus Bathyarchaeota archaeon]
MAEQQQGDVVLIGRKPTMNNVIACITLFNSGKQTITVRARGLVISHAVDTVELLRRAFIKDLEVQTITIGSQEFQNASDLSSNVSTIDIVISKSKK